MPRQPRRQFIRTLAAGVGAAAAMPAPAENSGLAEPTVELRPPERPAGIPTLWVGAVTHESATVKTKLPPGLKARLLVLKFGGTPLFFDPVTPKDPRSTVAAFHLTGLEPGTRYTCTLEVGGRPSTYPPAIVRTFPAAGQAASFQFAFSSCARTGSQHQVFSTIAAKDPSIFLHLGDLHYTNFSRSDPRLYRAAWDTILSSTTQGALYRSVPWAYIYDDHDFGPNDADDRNPGRPASRRVYREYAPHYPLPADVMAPHMEGDAPIFQAFTLARARFIFTDLRSERVPAKLPDDAGKSMMGPVQKDWFFRELLAASKTHGIIFWASSVPWIGKPGGDSWQAYTTERREICNFLARHSIHNLCILCGDAHMLAADDGRNSDYSDTQRLRIPVLHGSALDQGGSLKGGPYSHGTHPSEAKEGCFGWVEVKDDGQRVKVAFSGRNQDDKAIIQLAFEV